MRFIAFFFAMLAFAAQPVLAASSPSLTTLEQQLASIVSTKSADVGIAALDLNYEDDADGADDIIDLGIQVGKMRITERIGGLNRPRIAEEVSRLFRWSMIVAYGWLPIQ